ncbi:MAG TPA: aspartyl protease family protein [Thermoplasmata archaeon]|nr:aspartyl protease family protein [Thermoplasmata archaeon]
MGVFRVQVEFADPTGSRRIAVEAVVDTGSTWSKLPKTLADDLGLVASGRRRFRLANAEFVWHEVAPAQVSCEGRTAALLVAIGGDDEVPLLGATALELLGFAVDSVNQALVPTDYWMLAESSA